MYYLCVDKIGVLLIVEVSLLCSVLGINKYKPFDCEKVPVFSAFVCGAFGILL